MPSGDDRLLVLWVSYLGIVRRGDPGSLKLMRLPSRKTKARASHVGALCSDVSCCPAELAPHSDCHFVRIRVSLNHDAVTVFQAGTKQKPPQTPIKEATGI
eukprot:1090638-Amphidinium_carterae.2